MTLGNLSALRQTSLKRMLAYSSIAHAGYILVGLAAAKPESVSSILFYLWTYGFMNIGAFAVLAILERESEDDVTTDQLNGLASRRPDLAIAMAVFMLSLAGVPPLAGFFGKLYVFQAAVNSNLIWLVVIGVINSTISAYYYLRITVNMFMQESAAGAPAASGATRSGMSVTAYIAAVATLLIGLFPAPWLALAQQALAAFRG